MAVTQSVVSCALAVTQSSPSPRRVWSPPTCPMQLALVLLVSSLLIGWADAGVILHRRSVDDVLARAAAVDDSETTATQVAEAYSPNMVACESDNIHGCVETCALFGGVMHDPLEDCLHVSFDANASAKRSAHLGIHESQPVKPWWYCECHAIESQDDLSEKGNELMDLSGLSHDVMRMYRQRRSGIFH